MTQNQETLLAEQRFSHAESRGSELNPHFWSSERRDAHVGCINSPRNPLNNIDHPSLKKIRLTGANLMKKFKSQDVKKNKTNPIDTVVNPMFSEMRVKVKEMKNDLKNDRKGKIFLIFSFRNEQGFE